MSRNLYVSYIKWGVRRFLLRPKFATKNVKVGRGCSFGHNVEFNCKKVRIGNGVVFQDDIRINSDEFTIGDFGMIYFGCFFPGPGKITIGHNFWLGNNSIIDSQGGTVIGNNVGIGAHSQLWTHMKFGDTVAGCRFDSVSSLTLGDDVWLVGHNLVSPVTIGDRSLVMLGSLVTKDIPPDKVFAGLPAIDKTDKFGPQFSETKPELRKDKLKEMIETFALEHKIKNIWDFVEVSLELPKKWDRKKTIIDVSSRKYYKTGSLFEIILMRSLLPTAKYIPTEFDC